MNSSLIFALSAYFSMVRSSQDLVVDADMDVAILEKIVKSAKTEDLAAFRIWFLETFGRQNGYRLNNNDHSTEFKAFILVVSLTLINVEDEKGKEEKDLLPFLKTLLRKPTFSNCHNAVGTIYFGISNNPVRTIFFEPTQFLPPQQVLTQSVIYRPLRI